MKQKTKLVVWRVIGVIFALGPIWGMAGTALAMTSAFRHLAGSGSTNPEVLASDICFALCTTVAGWLACPIGIAILVVLWIKRPAQKDVDVSH